MPDVVETRNPTVAAVGAIRTLTWGGLLVEATPHMMALMPFVPENMHPYVPFALLAGVAWVGKKGRDMKHAYLAANPGKKAPWWVVGMGLG